MRNKGQNLIEFLIIVGLIGISCILALTFFGKNLNEMFSLSSIKFGNFKPFGEPVSSAAPIIVNNSQALMGKTTGPSVSSVESAVPVTPATLPSSPASVVISDSPHGTITQNSDGTVNIVLASGKTISNIDPGFMDNFKATVSQTTGSAGESYFIETLNKMVAEYLITNPTAKNVPLDVGFGGGNWNMSSEPTFTGSGGTTMYKIQVDKKVTVVYKEETNDLLKKYGNGVLFVFPGTINNNSFDVTKTHGYDTAKKQEVSSGDWATSYKGSITANSISGSWSNNKDSSYNGEMNFSIVNKFDLKGK